MQLKIVKNEDKIMLMNGEVLIETYTLSDSVDFSGFMSKLLDNDLKDIITFDTIEFEPSQQEEALIKVLNFIKDSYNKRVEEYSQFLHEQSPEKAR